MHSLEPPTVNVTSISQSVLGMKALLPSPALSQGAVQMKSDCDMDFFADWSQNRNKRLHMLNASQYSFISFPRQRGNCGPRMMSVRMVFDILASRCQVMVKIAFKINLNRAC